MRYSKNRDSGIELLKIIAIIAIVIGHTAQTIARKGYSPEMSEYMISLDIASTEASQLVLNVFRTFGVFGNAAFMVCSSWFLCENLTVKIRKLVCMEGDIWIISIAILVSFLFIGAFPITHSDILKSILPTTLSMYWYTTCYMIIYLIHPALNRVVEGMSKGQLRRCVICLFILYYVVGILLVFVEAHVFFSNNLVIFVIVYLIVAYLRKWETDAIENTRLNTGLLLCGILLWIAHIVLLNYVGTKISFLSSVKLWDKNYNPFIFITVIALFSLFSNFHFYNGIINYISSLSLLIYITHGHELVVCYLRPLLWQIDFSAHHHRHVIVSCILLSGIHFVVAFIISALYKQLAEKHIHKACGVLFDKIISFMPSKRNYH